MYGNDEQRDAAIEALTNRDKYVISFEPPQGNESAATLIVVVKPDKADLQKSNRRNYKADIEKARLESALGEFGIGKVSHAFTVQLSTRQAAELKEVLQRSTQEKTMEQQDTNQDFKNFNEIYSISFNSHEQMFSSAGPSGTIAIVVNGDAGDTKLRDPKLREGLTKALEKYGIRDLVKVGDRRFKAPATEKQVKQMVDDKINVREEDVHYGKSWLNR